MIFPLMPHFVVSINKMETFVNVKHILFNCLIFALLNFLQCLLDVVKDVLYVLYTNR